MADPRTTVRRALDDADVRPITLGTFHARRERKRRNERLAAGAVGLAIAVAGAALVSLVANRDRERTAATPTARNGAIAFISLQGDLVLRGPDGTVRIEEEDVTGAQADCAIEGSPCWFRGWSWSPDGSRLAFLYGEPSGGISVGDMSVYVVDADGENLHLVSRCPPRGGDPTGTCNGVEAPSWSPDGARLTFTSGEVLYVADATSGDVEPIAGCEGCAYSGDIHEPAWSPTGAWIAFGGDSTLELVGADGRAWRTIVTSTDDPVPGSPAEPVWSPDGTELAFSSERGIFVVAEDGSGLRQVSIQVPGEGPGSPSWSPDGGRIVFMNTPRTEDGFLAEIKVVDPDTGEARVLYRSACCVQDWGAPVPSPDGTEIAFSVGLSTGDFGIYVMDADGTDLRRSAGTGAPAWQALPA